MPASSPIGTAPRQKKAHDSRVVHTIAKNAISNLARMTTSWAVLLLLPPLLVRVLDKPTYATWMLILQVGAYVALVDTGLQSAVARHVARATGVQDESYVAAMLSSAAVVFLGCAVCIGILTLAVSWQLPRLFHSIPLAILSDARKAVLFVGFSLAVALPFSVIAGFFQGIQRNEVNAAAISIGKLVGAAGAAWAAYKYQNPAMMALWVGVGNLLQVAIFVGAWIRTGALHLLHSGAVAYAAVRSFLVFCSAMLASQLGSVLISGLDIPIVVAFDFHSAGYYAIAATVSNMLLAPQSAVVSAFMPVVANISAANDRVRLGGMLHKTTRYSTALLCAMSVPLMLALRPLLSLWVGKDYGLHALPIAAILLIAQIIRLTLLPYATIGFATGQQHRMLFSPLGEGAVNVAASLIGVHLLGAVGVALGTLIGALVGIAIHFAVSMERTDSLAFDRKTLLFIDILKPLACATPAIILAQISATWAITLYRQGLIVIVGSLLAAMLLLLVNFDVGERKQIRQLLQRLFGLQSPQLDAMIA
jgi:O-antigen/teichoic acid export membrane protein